MKRFRKKLLLAAALLAAWSLAAAPAALAVPSAPSAPSAFATETSAAPTRTVRIACIDYEGFFDRGADGTVTGYGAEMLNDLAQYTGWQYEFVFDTFATQMEKVKTGELDFICHAQKTPAREESYLFSDYATGAESSVLYARPDDNRYYYNDYQNFDGMTIAFLQGSFQNDMFAVLAEEHGFGYHSRLFPTQEASFAALDAGEVDAVAMGSLGGVDDYKVISLFGSDPFYFITGRENAELMKQLDSALGQLLAARPTYTAELYNKYYASRAASNGLLLTREEAEYIKNAEPVTVGLMEGRTPLSWADENGTPKGMLVDLMELVAQKSGLKFRYEFMGIGQTGMDFLQNGGGDLVAGVAASAFSTPNPALLQSRALQADSVVFVGRTGSEFSPGASLTVALPAGFINGESVVAAVYPSFRFYHAESNAECLAAIRDGKADVMLQNMYVIRECLQSPRYEDLEIIPAYSFEEDEKVVALPQNALLMSIVNKSISALTEDEKNKVVVAHTLGRVYQADVGELVYKYRAPLAGIVVLMAAVLMLSWSMVLTRQRGYLAVTQMNAQLERKNSALADAVSLADRANAAKSLFLSRMSHEIRTPMNAIVGLTAIAKQHENDPQKVEEYLAKIDTSSKVLLGIINDVLDMSAIESNKMKIANEEFDIKQVLTGISTIYYPQCEAKGVNFSMRCDLAHESFMGDSLRVSQILLNLVSNAFKFTEKDGAITVSAEEITQKDKTAFVRFSVTDTGAGMAPEMMARLFKPFEQEDASTAQKHGGSGLGLSIAKNLVDLMHGAIRVESKKGKGTTFTVEIPFVVVDRKNSMESNAVRKLRVLAVDDDSTAREYTAIVLKRIGVPFETAEGGQKALSMIEEAAAEGHPYDVVLLDWKMPDMNGVEVTRRIRQNEVHKTMIIIVSAYDLNEVEDEAKAAGADHFVSKPLFQSTVFNVLMTLSRGELHQDDAAPQEYDFTGHRVLVAEDNDLNAEIAAELLSMVKLSSTRAENGRRAVELFAQSKPGEYEAILMDVQMPELDGYEASRAIRGLNRPDAATIPIFAMTANAFNEDISRALSAGMNGHIAKPIETEILYKTLSDAIFKRQPRA